MVYLFETFRNESINSFELDPAHCSSTPGYRWDAMLRFTDVNLKLISDIEKYPFIESIIRSGISIIFKGYAEANNKFLNSYSVNKRTSYIIYLDTSNLYGHPMMQLLPTKIFDWVDPKDFGLHNYFNDSSKGCFLEVDIDYPDKLHDLQIDYLLAGRKIKVTEEMLLEYKS